jgi:Enoyl-CoA hydratase/carnithine racemase
MDFKTIDVDVADGIATLQLNQPEQANAMGEQMWLDIRDAFHWVDETPEIRVAVISGRGKHFSVRHRSSPCSQA